MYVCTHECTYVKTYVQTQTQRKHKMLQDPSRDTQLFFTSAFMGTKASRDTPYKFSIRSADMC